MLLMIANHSSLPITKTTTPTTTTKPNNEYCPEKCVCRKINENSTGLKLKCGGLATTKLTNIKNINFGSIASQVIQL